MRHTRLLVPIIGLLAPWGVLTVGATGTAGAAVTCDGKAPTIVTAVDVPTVGTAGDDVILGTDDRRGDVIDGAGGNDSICGLGGRDTLIGGVGDDRLFGGLDVPDYYPEDFYAGDLVVPGPGDDFIDLGDDPQSEGGFFDSGEYDRVSYRDAAQPVTVDLSAGTATGEGTDTIVVPQYSGGIIGSAFDDVLVGSDGHDTIQGGGGDDHIRGGDGDDKLEPDRIGPATWPTNNTTTAPGNDVVRAGDGSDYVLSVRGRDRLYGDDGDDGIQAAVKGSDVGGGAGDDNVTADAGVNVHGGVGNDRIVAALDRRTLPELDAGPGWRDVVFLTAPKDTFARGTSFTVDVAREAVRVNGRKRLVWQDVEALIFQGPRGRLTYLGGAGRDTVSVNDAIRVTAWGGRGRDALIGGKFADRLDGGPGRDILVGEAGRDRCLNGEAVRQCEVRR